MVLSSEIILQKFKLNDIQVYKKLQKLTSFLAATGFPGVFSYEHDGRASIDVLLLDCLLVFFAADVVGFVKSMTSEVVVAFDVS